MATKEEKRLARNANKRLNYWGGKRLKDVVQRRAQVSSWVETYDTVYQKKVEGRTLRAPAKRPLTTEARVS